MSTRTFIVCVFFLAHTSIAAAHDGPHRWVDLTHELSSESIFWPTAEPLSLTVDAQGTTELGYYYSAFSFCTAEHGGTHIDAPIHFAEGRETVDRISLQRLIGQAFVIDVSEQAKLNRDYQIQVDDLHAWEQEHGRLPDAAIVLFHTGYARFWPDPEKYLGTSERGNKGVADLHFPGLHPEAADWLLRERQVASVGIDTASIDHGQSQDFQTHVLLMRADTPVFENVANLDLMPPKGAFVVALPVKLKGGSGGPLRIVARIPETVTAKTR